METTDCNAPQRAILLHNACGMMFAQIREHLPAGFDVRPLEKCDTAMVALLLPDRDPIYIGNLDEVPQVVARCLRAYYLLSDAADRIEAVPLPQIWEPSVYVVTADNEQCAYLFYDVAAEAAELLRTADNSVTIRRVSALAYPELLHELQTFIDSHATPEGTRQAD